MSMQQVFEKFIEINELESKINQEKTRLRNLATKEVLEEPISYVSYLDKVYKISINLEDKQPVSVVYVGTFEDFKDLLKK